MVSQQFDELMTTYSDADQQQKEKIAHDIQTHWQKIEQKVRREVDEINEQLAVATARVTETTMKKQMLEISNSIDQSEVNMVQNNQARQNEQDQARSQAYHDMLNLSQKRILSKIQSFCSIKVKSLDEDISLWYLDNQEGPK